MVQRALYVVAWGGHVFDGTRFLSPGTGLGRELSNEAVQGLDLSEFGSRERGKQAEEQNGEKQASMIQLGLGLASLSKRTVERIHAGEYVDFAELPPAKGKMRAIPQSVEGQVIIVQAEDLMQTKKLIPDLPTWLQCFALFVSVAAKHKPDRLADLMAYMSQIAKASKKYRWPAWVVYDLNFRQEVAGKPEAVWARVDPSIYSQCFLGMAKSSEGWCHKCQSLDHGTADCPSGQALGKKRPWQMGNSVASPPVRKDSPGANPDDKPICLKFNRFDGDCRYGPRCRYGHKCSECKGDHPASRCPGAASPLNRR